MASIEDLGLANTARPMEAAQIPKNIQDLKRFAGETFANLISTYHQYGDKFAEAFDKPAGLISRCAGSTALLLLANNFEGLEKDSTWQQIVKNEFDAVCSHINDKGYDATPTVPESETSQVFSPKAPKQHYYLDSVAWVLSFALQLRVAKRLKGFEMGAAKEELVFRQIQQTLDVISKSMYDGGGWGFTSPVSAPDLYYSYAVSESLADFGDYVLGESSEEIGIEEDRELKKHLGDDLINRVEACRKKTAEWLIDSYLDHMGVDEINRESLKTGEKEHLLLYYTYFVIDMLVVNKADIFFPAKKEHINQAIEHALYLSRIHYDRAKKDPDKWWTDPKTSSLTVYWSNFGQKNLIKRRNDEDVTEPGLVPLSLRCNTLYAFYFAKGRDYTIDELFEEVYRDRDEETKLWDSFNFSLLVTERAVEAIVDYYDYLNRFEKEPDSELSMVFEKMIEASVRDYMLSHQGEPTIVALPQASAAGTSMDDNQFLISLTSVIAGINQFIKSGTRGSLEQERIRRFRVKLSEFMLELLHDSLKTGVMEPERHNDLKDATRTNLTDISRVLGAQLVSNPKVGEIPLLSLALKDLLGRVISPQGQSQAIKDKSTQM